jgi:hypothetical protein
VIGEVIHRRGDLAMAFSEYLKDEYGQSNPIYFKDVQFEGYSRSWISKELKKLMESGVLRRFDRGIYYFPIQMPYGEGTLSARKVVERRFLSDGFDIYGYVAGVSLLNQTGLSTQVPNLLELVTNRPMRVRDIKIGNQRVRAHRSRTTVTKENAKALQFLDLMNMITPSAMDETERFMLSKYIKASGVTMDEVSQYAGLFPRAMKNMVESRAAYELT